MSGPGPQARPRAHPVQSALAILAMIAATPVLALIALAVRADLGSPVLFAQKRAGLGGAPFTIRKFRTMTDGRDANGAPLPDDLRVTRLGRLLRRLRLDELPQIAALASGAMALIGPRPLLPATIDAMGPLGAARCAVRPGLTGWAQVSGNARLTDEEKLALDLWYVRHRTSTLDLLILAETVGVVLFGERRRDDRIEQARAALAAGSAPCAVTLCDARKTAA